MRRLLLAAGGVVLLAGCGHVGTTAKGVQRTSAPPPRVLRAAVGTPLTLTGTAGAGRSGPVRLTVKVGRVVRSARGKGAFERPRKGERFMAVRLALTNAGTTGYSDSPTYGARVVDTAGQTYDPTVAAVTAGPGFPRALRLRPGQRGVGYVVFAVPKDAEVAAVQYAVGAAYATEFAEWRLAVGNS